MGIDPSGRWTIVEIGAVGLLSGSLGVLGVGIYGTIKGKSATETYKDQAIAFTLGFAAGALAAYATLVTGHTPQRANGLPEVAKAPPQNAMSSAKSANGV